MVKMNMDLTDVPEGLGFDPVPKGIYKAHLVDSQEGVTRNHDAVLKLTWVILEGEHEGAKIFDQIMLSGSDKAVRFGERKLKAIAVAVGHHNPNYLEDSEELHGRPCSLVVGLRTYNDQETNDIKDYKHIPLAAGASRPPASAHTAPPVRQTAPPPPAPPAPPAHAAPPPPPPPGRPGSPFEAGPPAERPPA